MNFYPVGQTFVDPPPNATDAIIDQIRRIGQDRGLPVSRDELVGLILSNNGGRLPEGIDFTRLNEEVARLERDFSRDVAQRLESTPSFQVPPPPGPADLLVTVQDSDMQLGATARSQAWQRQNDAQLLTAVRMLPVIGTVLNLMEGNIVSGLIGLGLDAILVGSVLRAGRAAALGNAPTGIGGTAVASAPGARVTIGGVQATELAGRLSPAQMAALQQAHGTEFAQIYLTGAGRNGGGGTYYLIQGTQGNVSIPLGPNVRWINHTHPATLGGAPVPLTSSGADRNVLRLLQQSGSPQVSSQIVPEVGAPFRFQR